VVVILNTKEQVNNGIVVVNVQVVEKVINNEPACADLQSVLRKQKNVSEKLLARFFVLSGKENYLDNP
jgi:hypothetical protein